MEAISGDKVTYQNGDIINELLHLSSDENGAKTATVAGSLVLGSNEEVVGTSGYEPTINDGEGTLNGVNLTVSGKVDFQAGNWSNVGDVSVTGDGKLNVGSSVSMGKLTAEVADKVTVAGGSLTASAVNLVADSVEVSVQGSVTLDANDVIKAYDDESYTVTVTDGAEDSSKFEAGSVSLDGTSTLTLNGANTSLGIDSVDGTAFQKIYEDIMGANATGTLVLEGVTVTVAEGDKTGGNVNFDAANKYQGSNALASETVTGVDDTLSGGTHTWGSAVLDGETDALTVDGADTSLTLDPTAAGSNNFVTDSEGHAANIALSNDASVLLSGAGEAKDVTGSGDVIFAANGATQNVGKIDLTTATVTGGTVKASSSVKAGTLEITGGTLNNTEATDAANSTITASNSTVKGGTIATGTLTLGDEATEGDYAHSFADATIVADNLTLKAYADSTTTVAVNGGSDIVVNNTFTGTSGAVISVGTDGDEDTASSTGSLHAGTLDLNGAKLVIDPDYDQVTAVVSAKQLKNDTLTGDVVIGQNSAFGVKFDSKDALLAQLTEDGLRDDIALRPEVGAVAYFNAPVIIGKDIGMTLDPSLTDTAAETEDPINNTITMESGSAIVLTDGAFGGRDANGKLNSETAITFAVDNPTKGTVTSNGGKILLSGKFFADDSLKIVDTADASITNEIEIKSITNVIEGTLKTDGTVDLQVNRKAIDQNLTALSAPMKDLVELVLEGGAGVNANAAGASFLSEVANSSTNGGKDVEAAARMAVFGGAVQATLMAQQASTDAVSDRLNMANPNGNLIFADNAQGGGLWLMPVYKNHDSDEFDADGVDYGADIDLYGAALGADFTTASGVRVGGYFNVGSGDADGQGVGDEVSNDFDYFGLGIYAGMNFGQFALTADAGFTQVSNDLEQSAYLGKLTADTDTTAVTFGVKGEYAFETAVVDITPHIGMRYTRLDMDSYDAKLAGEVIASTDADSMDVFSIPVGVTFSKDIAAGDWTVKPVFDLTLTANAGDTEFDTDTVFSGTGVNAALSSEIMDDFTYGGTLGIQAKYGQSFSFGVNASYVGSDAADEFGVTGDVRYMF